MQQSYDYYIKNLDALFKILKINDDSYYLEWVKESHSSSEVKVRAIHCLARLILFMLEAKNNKHFSSVDKLRNESLYLNRMKEKYKVFPHPGIDGAKGNKAIPVDTKKELEQTVGIFRIIQTYL